MRKDYPFNEKSDYSFIKKQRYLLRQSENKNDS